MRSGQSDDDRRSTLMIPIAMHLSRPPVPGGSYFTYLIISPMNVVGIGVMPNPIDTVSTLSPGLP